MRPGILNHSLPLFMLFVLASCNDKTDRYREQDKRFRNNYKAVLGEVAAMFRKDQELRHYAAYGTTDSLRIDSLERYFEDHNINGDSLETQTGFSGLTTMQKDSLENVMTALNKKHTVRMIELISEYGYPSSLRIDTGLKIEPDLLLEHGDWAYKDTVMKLLATELRLKRMDSSSYEFIRWNMNGRVGFPLIPGVTVLQQHEDGTTDTIRKGD